MIIVESSKQNLFIYLSMYIVKITYLTYCIQYNVKIIMMTIITMIILKIKIIIIVLFWGFSCLILLFWGGFIWFFQRKMPTNVCIIYFFIRRWRDRNIWKILFSILKLKISRRVKYSWWPKWLFWGFQYSHFCSCSPAKLIRFHCPSLGIFFLMFMFPQLIYN